LAVDILEMKKRGKSMISFQLSFFLMLTIAIPMLGGKSEALLSASEEKSIRDIVYGEQTGTVLPTSGKYAKHEILTITPDLQKIYDNKPDATLDLLNKMIEGGNPRDSSYAAACACTLCADDPVLGAVIRRTAHAKTYDVFDSYWEETPREHNIRMLLIVRKEKKDKDLKPPEEK
jgi:hypothetical protein